MKLSAFGNLSTVCIVCVNIIIYSHFPQHSTLLAVTLTFNSQTLPFEGEYFHSLKFTKVAFLYRLLKCGSNIAEMDLSLGSAVHSHFATSTYP